MPDFFQKSTYHYDLPESLIAQVPVSPRDHCRLLVLDRETQERKNLRFDSIIDFLSPGDLIVRNDTRVMPARLFGRKARTGGAVELLLLRPLAAGNRWEGLVRPGRKLKPGTQVDLGSCLVTLGERLSSDGTREILFPDDVNPQDVMTRQGELPLPPYITSRASDDEDYQTVYSKEEKSAAAPTAGLHFTTDLFEAIKRKGVRVADVTLEVGLGTFRPLSHEDIRDHVMHRERCRVPAETLQLIKETKQAGGRVFALGTTVTRTLEAYWQKPCGDQWFETDLFIFPGFRFQVIDGLITNFHLPESTLLMLVAAFAGYDFIMDSYRYAVKERYRFFSFGDAMLIL